MPIEKYRSVADMPPPWTDPDDPKNLCRIAALMTLWFRLNARPEPGVRRFRSIADASRDDPDPYRSGT